MRRGWLAALVVWAAFSLVGSAGGGGQAPKKAPAPPPAARDEPLAKAFSLAKAAEALDAASVHWTQTRNCGTCHTNISYLLARPALKENAPAEQEVRRFFENRVANWDRGRKGAPRWDAEVVVTAVALAVSDHHAGKLHPRTRAALDRMWRLQKKHGAWSWLKCDWPPMEHDDYFGAVFAAVGVAMAPDGYATGKSARAGLARLRGYFQKNPPPNLHHKAWLLWGATRIDGLMTPEQRDATVKELLAGQKADGGWSLHRMADWEGVASARSDASSPSDGYGTGLAVVVLRHAGLAKDHPAVWRGVVWLKANQRASGRWFTHSLNRDKTHLIANAGSALALLAVKMCE